MIPLNAFKTLRTIPIYRQVYRTGSRLYSSVPTTSSSSSGSTVTTTASSPLNFRWFYSTDVPVTKPKAFNYTQTERPNKFIPFSRFDSERLESVFQAWRNKTEKDDVKYIVPVNEDQLFDCDISQMIMKPAYWDGPGYEIRRGTWFLDALPLTTGVAEQLENAYQEFRPFNARESKKPLIKEIQSELNIYEKEKQVPWPFKNVSDFQKKNKLALFKDSRHALLIDEDYTIGKLWFERMSDSLPADKILGGYTVTRGYDSSKYISFKDIVSRSKNELRKDKVTKTSEEQYKQDDSIMSKIKQSIGVDDSNERWQNDIEGDYSTNPHTSANAGNREVDHLILSIHGIGQSLSSEFSAVNFAHDCNSLRKLLKSLFVQHPETYAPPVYPNFKKGVDDIDNCKVQVLPIIWRNSIDFSLDYEDPETDEDGSLRLPTLSQLNLASVTPLRRFAADVVLDVLLYYEPRFKEKILSTVIQSANDLYDKYLERHPDFKGKVSLLGHSLGSSIGLDILSSQPDVIPTGSNFDSETHLKFEVENYFGCGSPNGVFKFMKRQNVRPRAMYPIGNDKTINEILELPVQSPKVSNYYNIFYPTDLVAYRVEPLIHPSLAHIKPSVIPFADKEGLNSKLQTLSRAPYDLADNQIVKSFMDFTGLQGSLDKYLSPLENKDTNANTSININTDPSAAKSGQQIRSYSKASDAQPEGKVSKMLYELNKSGRVDYSLPEGYFDIDLINVLGSHTKYLEDPDVAGFILLQLFKKPSEAKATNQ